MALGATATVAFVVAFAICWIAIAILGAKADRLGLIDAPTGRKQHHSVIPLVGGLAIVAATAVAAFSVMVSMGRMSDVIAVVTYHTGYFLGAGALLAVGIWDDRKPVPALLKLGVQLAACCLAVLLDQTLVGTLRIAGAELTPGPLVIPFTILVMLTITNAINMIDGLDGLAGGITFAGFALIAKALLAADYGSAPFVLALLGALTAFLAQNFPLAPGRQARVFLGDAGSLVLGFTLAYLTVDLSALPNRLFSPTTALWFFFIPVADAIWLYVRRAWIARAPFTAGRDHVHHILAEWLPAFAVTWLLVLLSIAFAAAAYYSDRIGVSSLSRLIAWIIAFFVYGLLTHRPWLRAWNKSAPYRQPPREARETV